MSDSRAYVSTEAGWTLRYTDPATSDFTSGVTITGSAHLVGIADVVEAELQRQAPALAINVNGRQGWVVIGQTQFAPGNQTTTSLIFEMTGGMTVRIDATATAEQTLAMAKQLVPILPSEWPNLDLKPTASPPPPSDQLNYTTFALTVNRLDGGAPAMAYLFRSGVACLDLGGGDFYAACSPLSIENENSWVSASGPIASGIVRTAGLVPGYVTRVRILPDVGPPTEVVPQFDVDTSVRAFVADTPPPAHWVDVELLDAHGNIIRRIPHRNAGTRLPVAGPPALSDPSWKPATIVQGYNPATLTEPQVLVRQTTYKDGTTGECVLFSMPSTTTSTDYNDCGRRPLPTAGDEPSVWVTVSSSRPVIMAVLPPGAVHAEIVYPFSNVVDLPIWAGATRKYVAITAEAGRYPLELRFRSADGTIIATAGFGPTQNYFAYGGSS